MFDVDRHTIFLTLAGSQAHGTARETSDVDARGVCVAPLSVRLSLFDSFEQHEGALGPELSALVLPALRAHPTASRGLGVKTECVVFDVAKFVRLCAEANPNALEILFADERDWLLETPTWRRLWKERQRFLTKKVHQTFVGYAMSQLRRIKTHRAWLLDPPKSKPTRGDFGLPDSGGTLSRDDQNRIEQVIAATIRNYGIDDIEMPKATRIAVQGRMDAFHRDLLRAEQDDVESRTRALALRGARLPPDVVATLEAEKKYQAALKHWGSYERWKRERNRDRADLERAHGYDTKHAMHMIRLMRMGLEILERGEVDVRRPDAPELRAIRDGALSFDELMAAATDSLERIERAAAETTLPEDVDREEIDRIALSLQLGSVG